MERNQFTFYVSFYKTIQRIKGKAARAEAYDAICAYALNGVQPDLEKMPVAAAMAVESALPSLDASRRKAENGSQGGSAKQTESKTEANDKQTVSKAEANDKQTVSKAEANAKQTGSKIEDKIEIKNKIEHKCSLTPPYGGGRRRKVPNGSAGTAPLGAEEEAALAKMLRGVKTDA